MHATRGWLVLYPQRAVNGPKYRLFLRCCLQLTPLQA
jgi:hypothetical protein